MEEEIWRRVPGYKGVYEISNQGGVRSYYTRGGGINFEKVPYAKRPSYGARNRDYVVVGLTKAFKVKFWPLHKLLALVFIPNPDPKHKKYVNHIDGDKTNNDLSNLEWCTASENQKHAYRTGLRKKNTGQANGRNKLNAEQVLDVFSREENTYHLADEFGVSRGLICHIKQGKIWGEITGKKYEKKYFNPLNDERILEIYKSSLEYTNLARIYGVDPSTISAIKTGRTHSELTGAIFRPKRYGKNNNHTRTYHNNSHSKG
jgi:hypothetical protein